MKKIFALFVCTILLVCAFHISAFAEGESFEGVEPNEVVVDTSTPTEETATESEISGDRTLSDVLSDLSSESIVAYIEDHIEELGVIFSLIGFAVGIARKFKWVNKAISATNHNAITVAENADRAIADATARMEAFSALFAKYQESEEEKKELKKTIDEAMTYIKASKLANIEFANELAELLVLANIPNSKKEELYSRHIAAVHSIEEAEVVAHENRNEA